MKILRRISYVDVIGHIWMPNRTAAMRYTLDAYAINNIKAEDDNGKVTRDAVEQWLTMNSGDFREVTDFSASIEDGPDTINIDWADDESEFTYSDCMYPDDRYDDNEGDN